MPAHRYKFQAMVELDPAGAGGPTVPPGQVRRMVVRGRHHQTHSSHFFSALVSNNGDGPAGLADGKAIVTIVLAGDDLRDYFGVGDQFSLWLGGDVGHGVVTRRLFV